MRAMLICLLIGWGITDGFSQNNNLLLKKYNTDGFHQLFSKNVKVEINRKKTMVARTKAAKLISEKLKTFRPVRWENVHKGSAEGKDDDYFVTEVYNKNDEGLRIFVHLVMDNGTNKIASVRFRKVL